MDESEKELVIRWLKWKKAAGGVVVKDDGNIRSIPIDKLIALVQGVKAEKIHVPTHERV